MTPFERGFLKQAAFRGVAENAALELAKYGSGTGAYFASGPVQRGYELNSPIFASLTGGSSGLLGAARDMVMARSAGKTEHDRRHVADENTSKLEHEGYGANAHRYGKTFGKAGLGVGGVLGALAGGLGGAAGVMDNAPAGELDNDQAKEMLLKLLGHSLGGAALGGVAGAGVGGLTGYLGGGANGLYDKFVTNNTDEDSKQRAKTFKTKHPYATALPYGDLFGAALSKDMKPSK